MYLPKIITTLAVFAAVGVYGCTSSDVPWSESETDDQISQQSILLDENKRTAEEAVGTASRFFYKSQSRASVDCHLRVEGLTSARIRGNNSRSESGQEDTLVYVVNRDNGGFMLVSSDKRMPEVLAFSETGEFEVPDDPDHVVNAVFLSNVDAYRQYLIEGSGGYNFKPSDNLFDEMIELCPEYAWRWNQHESPYADVVWREHPGCPVGCVGLAAGIILTYCRDEVAINDSTKYNAYAARRGMIYGQDGQRPPIIFVPLNDNVVVPSDSLIFYPSHFYYAYKSDALSHISWMLSEVGKELNLNYNVGITSGVSYRALLFLKNVGCNVLHSLLQNFDINAMARQIVAGNILYAEGSTYTFDERTGAHAWIIDGCCFNYLEATILMSDDLVEPQRVMTDVFLHCNWGENTQLIGYYRGDIFRIHSNYNNYRNMHYFAVKPTREYSSTGK